MKKALYLLGAALCGLAAIQLAPSPERDDKDGGTLPLARALVAARDLGETWVEVPDSEELEPPCLNAMTDQIQDQVYSPQLSDTASSRALRSTVTLLRSEDAARVLETRLQSDANYAECQAVRLDQGVLLVVGAGVQATNDYRAFSTGGLRGYRYTYRFDPATSTPDAGVSGYVFLERRGRMLLSLSMLTFGTDDLRDVASAMDAALERAAELQR